MRKGKIWVLIYALILPVIYYYVPHLASTLLTMGLLITSILLWNTKAGVLAVVWSFGWVIVMDYYSIKINLIPALTHTHILLSLFMVLGFGIPYDMMRKEKQMRIESEENLRSITDSMLDVMVKVNLDGIITYISSSCQETLGLKADELLGTYIFERIHPEDLDKITHDFKCCLEHNKVINTESRYLHGNGHYIWLESTGKTIVDENGTPISTVAVSRDISEWKRYQEKIIYLSYHDKLTGLHNRAFFEEELERLDQEGQYPLSVIIGDVNGLKLTNDIFGHAEGDKLLIQIAKIIKEHCRKDDVFARWGGDEFAIILPKTDEITAMKIWYSIVVACKTLDYSPVQISISIGTSTKNNASESIHHVLNEAEKNMYRHKLLEGKSARSTILSSLQNTLFERSNETQEHAQRLQELGIQLGKSLGLMPRDIDKLSLLAVLHDIGKIAISDSVLKKPGRLDHNEWEEIKKHPEIGYRIAQSSPELSHISDEILHHHERWDGKGYPQGLKGDEIPLLSRIISVIDAYDVMTNERVYKAPMELEEALEEINRCAGAQFDPYIAQKFIELMTLKLKQAM